MIARAIGLLLALMVLIGVILVGALWSTAGNRMLVRLGEEALAPALNVTSVSGSVLTELCAESIRFDTEGVQVLAEDVCINPRLWSSFDFLKVDLQSARASSVKITTLPVPETTGPAESTALSLPIDIAVDELDLGRLSINGLVLEAVRMALDLTNSNLVLAGSLVYERNPVELATRGGWSNLQLNARGYGAELGGEVDLVGSNLPWKVRVTSRQLDVSELVERPTELRALVLEGEGNLASYLFDATGSVEDELGNGAFSLAVNGNLRSLKLERADLSNVVLNDLPMQVEALHSTGSLTWSDGIRLELDGLRLMGSMNAYELAASADKVTVTDTEVVVRTAAATIDESAEVKFSGRAGFDGRLEFSADANQFPLALMEPRLGGLADLHASVGGSLTAPYVMAEGTVRALAWETETETESETIGDLTVSVDGSRQTGTGRMGLSSDLGEAEFTLDYEQIEDAYQIRLAHAAAHYDALGARAELAEPVSVVAGVDRLKFDQACITLSSDQLDALPGRLCADLDYPDGALRLELEPWVIPRLSLPNSEVSVQGKMGLAIDMTAAAPLAGSAEVSLTDLIARHPDLDPLRLGDLSARVSIEADRLKATIVSPSAGSQELLFDGALETTLADEPFESPIAGSASMELDGIWVAQSLLPMDVAYELENVRGRMAVNTVISGSVRDPVIDGSFKLSNAGWQVPALNADISDLQALATLKGSERIEFNSTAAVGGGRVLLNGDIDGLNTDSPRLSTAVSLENAELVDLPDYQAAVDGSLALEMEADRLTVTGNVHLPRARVLIADLPETAVTASSDEVIVDEEREASLQQVRHSDVTLTLGDEVYLEAFGLSGRLSGKLRVVEEPGRLRAVTGVINLNQARFEAYGQKLSVERGQLTFSGPVDDPAVDVVATRIVDYDDREYRISLLITGTANDLRTQVLSQPSLPEDDALALLITGRTFSQISSSEQSNVSGAALSMGLLSASGMTQHLADALNLEEVIVDQDADGNMEVGAAVRLNGNIYLRYTYGVFSRLGGVLLRYRVSNRFSVQATTGDAQSIELRYGVDE